jgi:hypothetical protein
MQGGQADALTDHICSTATSSCRLATGRQADRAPTEMFEEGAAIAICFAPEHCVLLER